MNNEKSRADLGQHIAVVSPVVASGRAFKVEHAEVYPNGHIPGEK